jgi:hypothetical protein
MKGGPPMLRRLVPYLVACSVAIGCAGTSKLTEKSEEKLAKGDAWKAWELATRALDKEPGNPRARSAATAAGTSIVEEWQRRVRALAEVDSLKAADEVLELTAFREGAARYATIPVGEEWREEEETLRQTAAREYYESGRDAASAGLPKKAWVEFNEAERFVPGYRDVAKRSERALRDAATAVAVVPFETQSSHPGLGVDVAKAWRDDLLQSLTPPRTRFTRILGGDAIEGSMRVSELDGLTRDDAIRLARKAGAQRVVWGSIGRVHSNTRIDWFRDTVSRRVVVRNSEGQESAQWVDVPIEVVARVRDVKVGVDYEVISTRGGASLASRHYDRTISARVVWTSHQPEGDPASYDLVSETTRASNPKRAKDVESRWKSVCGDATTLVQVLEARRSAKGSKHGPREALPRFAAGAAFVFLEELPSPGELAYTALTESFSPVRGDLLKLDMVDDAELTVAPGEGRTR